MTHDELEEMHFLWDGSEDWALSAFHHSEVDLKIVFEADHPSIQEIMALRKLIEEYREMPVHQIKARIGASKELAIGKRSTLEAQPLSIRARELGLNLIQTDASHVSYLPLNQTDQSVCVIEDDELSERVVQRMLAAGAPITEQIEVD